MSQLASLIDEVGGAMERRPEPARARALAEITDMFCRDADRLDPTALSVYDGVLQRVAVTVDAAKRAEFAERLVAVANGPKGVLRSLALDDDIAVARPVLMSAHPIEDQDLIAVASGRGAEHRLAICGRTRISEAVTDALVGSGERPVHHAIASNNGARFSSEGTALLLDASRDDEKLQDALGSRRDLPPHVARQLVTITEQHVRKRMVATLPSLRPRPKREGL